MKERNQTVLMAIKTTASGCQSGEERKGADAVAVDCACTISASLRDRLRGSSCGRHRSAGILEIAVSQRNKARRGIAGSTRAWYREPGAINGGDGPATAAS
ncbi:hypothetical protein Asi03nite_45560 [Actinoplanes siamensis]|uniref:Uncharacterized protein n=1 Tax=Actinoplanes siamensis TaxID=1223317 RepID=A0A919N9J6_9ACTN|nr:hypothetical protein Asi03nite_45560 [Actinoplanes siamensis]